MHPYYWQGYLQNLMQDPFKLIEYLVALQLLDVLAGVINSLKQGNFSINTLPNKFKNDVGIILYLLLLAPAYQLSIIQVAWIAGWGSYVLSEVNSILKNFGLSLPNINDATKRFRGK